MRNAAPPRSHHRARTAERLNRRDDRFKNGDSCTSAEWCPQFITEHVHSMTICGVASMKSMYPVAWKPKYFLFSAILHVCSLDLVLGGMCWASMGKNGLCKDLLAERLSKEQCCKLGGSSVSTSWSPTDLDPGALFFWRVLGDGVPCTKCKGSCTDVECVPGKKCVMRSGSPKCICSPNCKQRDGFKGPVCGTDGVSYKSHCRLKKRSCRTRDQSLSVDYIGMCQNSCNKVACPTGKYCLQDQNLIPHCVKCATFCPRGMLSTRFVCGSDGWTYQSACHLREAACRIGKAIPIAYKGVCKKSATCATVSCKSGQKCLVEKKTGRPRCVTCNLLCSEAETSGKRKDTSGKVCGSNDKTYHSWCQMFMDACATGVVIETKASGPCRGDIPSDVFNGNWNYVNGSNVLIDGI